MPLLKKKPHKLLEPPKDLDPHDLVYQVQFTKEIFRDYQSYLKRINLYRKRLWTCKYTGKTNLIYEEALVSERHASEKVQALPKELVAPALRIIQFSMLSLKDLADTIVSKLQARFFVGAELYGKRDGDLYLCKILKIVEKGTNDKPQYEVGWFDRDKEIYENAVLCREDLTWKKFPFSRNLLKSVIRESTSRSIPWVVHGNLAQLHGIPSKIPEELQSKYIFKNGQLIYERKRKKIEEEKEEIRKGKKKRDENGRHVMERMGEEANEPEEEPINYPIEDLLVQPGPGDPEFTERPSPSQDFNVPEGCVRDLLMITLITWTEYLCDFLEVINVPELCSHIATIKRGHYGLLDPNVKLGILRELVKQTTETSLFKKELDQLIEQRHALGAARRGEALEEGRKKREKKELSKSDVHANGILDEHSSENKNGIIPGKRNEVVFSEQNGLLGKSVSKHLEHVYQRKNKKQITDTKIQAKEEKDLSGTEQLKLARDDEKETSERRGAEQRREYYERKMEKLVIHTNPLGKDRHYNRYWWFRHDGRIFVESPDSEEWGYYSSKEELDALMGSLNCKGERELSLHKQLEKFYDRICTALQKRSKDIAHNSEIEEEAVLRRSTRVRAPLGENPASAFLRYVNKLKDD